MTGANYDGGIGQNINQESHGGSFYCAIASLKLLGRLDAIADIDKTVNWALDLQKSGFCGRTNKVEDTCYTFWVGAGVTMLGFSGYIDKNQLVKFVFKCIGSTGGVSKTPNSYPGNVTFN
ncbi:Geranylgeranyl transferase type-1 subunit beta [Zancudomyces culisetae]|uniref:Geranylgeranyl transferase type-1 subunit beta n=1 Tax=Zancudomyces culisetae TaxID=1213189 RepID=A0A1R1PM49_ZANCU|nr:Geranylgeranyl transferase type-1 subunit beta [Zancudomyces culisetae]|eukprot:OMH82048.1 Geranylgeranyl transferase type-1 subunit beta [Zancudomyces culisetae]